MILKTCVEPETREKLLTALGPIAWLALILSIFINRMGNPDLDFLMGILVGFSIVGNLVHIYTSTRSLRGKQDNKF